MNLLPHPEGEEVPGRMFPDLDRELLTADHIRDALLDALN